MENVVKIRRRALKQSTLMRRRRKRNFELMEASKALAREESEEESQNDEQLNDVMEPVTIFCENYATPDDEEDPLSFTFFRETNAVKQYSRNPVVKSKPTLILKNPTEAVKVQESKATFKAESKANVVEVETVKCRCCLKEAPKFLCKPFDSKFEVGNAFICARYAVFYTTGVQLFEDESKPNHFCHECWESLKTAFKFKDDFTRAEAYLIEKKEKEEEAKVGWFDENYPPIEPPPTNANCNDKNEESKSSLLCDHCGIEFADKNRYQHHQANIETVHMLCEYCGKEFTKMRSFMDHVKTHTRKLDCRVCNKTLTSYKSYLMHRRFHRNPKKYQCRDCGECFLYRDRLIKHSSTHTGVELFVCKICSKSLYSKWSLGVHMRLHTGEKPFVCKICNRDFTHNVSLKTHMEKGCEPAESLNDDDIKEEPDEVSDDKDNEG